MRIIWQCAARWGLFLVGCQIAHPQQSREKIPVNYDESAVGNYVLPDPLKLANGQRVRDVDSWWKKRRPEILRLFETNIYGRSPERPVAESFEVFDLDRAALDGNAVRKQVTVYFSKNKDGPREDVLIYLPAGASKPVPLILSLNFSGNQSIVGDPAVRLPVLWDRTKAKRDAFPESRGKSKDFIGAVQNALARGYGFASIYYGQVEPDFREGLAWGVRGLFLRPGQIEPAADEWGAIAAWGWGLSRAMDYVETDRDIDSKRVAILGHSRLGKTVLWAGARDTRFAMVIANCSGEGGASLARRNYGETVKHMNVNFPYQFAANFQKFGDQVDQLPVDTHELISLIAPRFLYLGTAEEDQWADTRGEFLAAVAAGPVYRLFGKKGLETTEMPALNKPIMHDIGYHYRNGKHEITRFDWEQFLSFADLHWK